MIITDAVKFLRKTGQIKGAGLLEKNDQSFLKNSLKR